MYYAGQISSRLGFVKVTPLMIAYLILIIICWIVSIAARVLNQENWNAVYILPLLFIAVFMIILRYKFVGHFGINENSIITFLAGFFCLPCSLCQMGRHMWGYTRRFDGDADMDGLQSYHHPHLTAEAV